MPMRKYGGCEAATGAGQQKRQPELPFPFCRKLHRSPKNHFFRWANLLRNFSTRPPSESTLFCVPV